MSHIFDHEHNYLQVFFKGKRDKQKCSPFDLIRSRENTKNNFDIGIVDKYWDYLRTCQVVITLECLRKINDNYEWVPHPSHHNIQFLSSVFKQYVTEEPPTKVKHHQMSLCLTNLDNMASRPV